MDALNIISQDHSNMWRLAITIDHIATDIEQGAPVESAFFNAAFDYIDQFVDRFHHPKEDDYLFRLLRLRSTEAADILDQLELEHREGPDTLAALRARVMAAAAGELSGAQIATELRNYTAILKNHIRTEEKSVLPLARNSLIAADWAEINQAFLDNSDPVFGEKAQAEFRQLYHRVVSLAPESVG